MTQLGYAAVSAVEDAALEAMRAVREDNLEVLLGKLTADAWAAPGMCAQIIIALALAADDCEPMVLREARMQGIRWAREAVPA